MMVLSSAFAPRVKGFARLQTLKAKLVYGRLKFERYLEIDWLFGMNPC